MNTLTKVLAALMLTMGLFFSTTASAWVDCDGLSERWSSNNFQSQKDRCNTFQSIYGNTNRNWIDPETGIVRLANQEWDGVVRYASDIQASKKVESKAVVEKKSNGQFLSERDGFYLVIEKNGIEIGLEKIKKFAKSDGFSEANITAVINHLEELPLKEIVKKSDTFKMHSNLKKFLEDEEKKR